MAWWPSPRQVAAGLGRWASGRWPGQVATSQARGRRCRLEAMHDHGESMVVAMSMAGWVKWSLVTLLGGFLDRYA